MSNAPRYYISLAFARYAALRLAGFAENIATKTALITVFTPTEPPLADITTAAMNLRIAEEATDLQTAMPSATRKELQVMESR